MDGEPKVAAAECPAVVSSVWTLRPALFCSVEIGLWSDWTVDAIDSPIGDESPPNEGDAGPFTIGESDSPRPSLPLPSTEAVESIIREVLDSNTCDTAEPSIRETVESNIPDPVERSIPEDDPDPDSTSKSTQGSGIRPPTLALVGSALSTLELPNPTTEFRLDWALSTGGGDRTRRVPGNARSGRRGELDRLGMTGSWVIGVDVNGSSPRGMGIASSSQPMSMDGCVSF